MNSYTHVMTESSTFCSPNITSTNQISDRTVYPYTPLYMGWTLNAHTIRHNQ